MLVYLTFLPVFYVFKLELKLLWASLIICTIDGLTGFVALKHGFPC